MEKYFEVTDMDINIKCKMFCKDPRNINSVLLACHGFGGNKENSATKKLAKILLERHEDVAVIAFDWPCHGQDFRQKLSLTDCNNYLQSMIDYIHKDLDVSNISVQGTSFGGYLILKYVSEHENPFEKIALRCPAINMHQILTSKLLSEEQKENIKKGKVEVAGFSRKIKITKEFLDELELNDITKREYYDIADDTIVFQGTDDEIVDYDKVIQFCDDNVIDCIPIKGADHRFQDAAKMRECIDYMAEFYEDVLSKKRTI